MSYDNPLGGKHCTPAKTLAFRAALQFRTIYYEMVLWYQFYPEEHVVLLAVSEEIPHQKHFIYLPV